MLKKQFVVMKRDRKTGKMRVDKVVKYNPKTVDKTMEMQNQGATKTPGQRAYIAEQNRHKETMAKIAGKQANIASAIGSVTATINRTLNNVAPKSIQTGVTETAKTPTVNSLVNAGASSSTNTRDDEDEDGYAEVA